MDNQDTTTEEVVDSGVQDTLPEETTQTEAVEATSEQATEQSQETGDPESLPVDEKLQKFADSHGLTLDNESAIKAAKIAMDNKASYQRTRQKASELEKTMQSVADTEEVEYEQSTGQTLSETERLVRKLYVKDSIRTFFESNPDASQYEQQMAKIVTEKPHLAGDLESLYAVARANDTESLKSQGGREALESLAGKQRASAPTGSAVNSMASKAKITRAEINSHLQSGDTKWYNDNLAEINKMVADGTLQ